MGSNYISDDATILTSTTCIHDSNIAYTANFSVNGEVDGWDYYDAIHTYGVWDGFLFGTIYDSYAIIGRRNVFRAVDATTHYTLKIAMKYNPQTRTGTHALPTEGKVRWRTLSNTQWDSVKEKTFTIYADNLWHTYSLNMGTEQYWQGDVNDLRIWVATSDAEDGDEFFIRTIEISSVESHACLNVNCNRYSQYTHPCPWVGERGFCQSAAHSASQFSIDEDSELIININDYGNEVVKVKEVLNGSGQTTANALARAISRVDIGGYSETQVVFTDDNEFRIYSGTTESTSSVVVVDNDLARYLNFFSSSGADLSSRTTGELPATGYSPLSSFKTRTSQILALFDNSSDTYMNFSPFGYSVEGGRQDWIESSVGLLSAAIGANDGDESGQVIRDYFTITNNGRTIIDFNHPFNASGRITKVYAACTLDMDTTKAKQESVRIAAELSGAKLMIFRPKRDGTLDVIYEFDITDRDAGRDYNEALYSLTQEVVELDVDVFVNRGDFLGIYNSNLYVGRSISGDEVDAQYFQVNGKPTTNFDPGRLNGNGAGGVLMYARGDDPQLRLVLDIDLKNRYNLENIEIKGLPKTTNLEYNIARCLDIDWHVSLFGNYHWTAHKKSTAPGEFIYQRYNTAYGIGNLNDGITTVPDGLACDSYTLTTDNSALNVNWNAGPGVVPTNPHYFWVNGDEEWLGVWLHAQWFQTTHAVYDFDYDPIAIFMHFPFEKEKTIYKLKIYFKEKFNFRSFALSTYRGAYDALGDADDPHYSYIPASDYTAITLDGVRYDAESDLYSQVDEYLFKNPAVGHALTAATSDLVYEWDPILSDVIRDYSGETGYFVYQTATVLNADSWEQARRVDWQTIQHEWEPTSCKGFRIYTDFHKSTKICEMELYGVAEDIGSAFAGGIDITYSDYNEIWWPTTSIQQEDTLVEVYVGDTPRYLTIELMPIVETRYDDIVLNVKTEDVYVGSKGCEYNYYLEHSKLGATNKSQVINLKNIYQNPYDLYVDITPDSRVEDGLIFYSDLSSEASINNPELGPDARYYKQLDYDILNDDHNCAINCNTYGLHNLIDGRTAYYSYDKMISWQEFGQLTHGTAIDFHNLDDVTKTYITLPVLSRNRYWKIGVTSLDPSISIRECNAYDESGTKYTDIPIYHDLDKTFEAGSVYDRAPHLSNGSLTGSYYTLAENQHITFDLGPGNILQNVELFHDGIADYSNTWAGIDKYTKLCLRPWADETGGYITDYSYYEHSATLEGSAFVARSTSSNIQWGVDLGCLTDWADWEIKDNYYSSTFSGTCASGTITDGIYEFPGYYDFNLACSYWSQDGIYYDLKETDVDWKLWQNVPFEIKFKLRVDSFGGATRDDGSITVGLFGDKQYLAWGLQKCNLEFLVGAQLVYEPDSNKFFLAVRENQTGAYDGSTTEGAHSAGPTFRDFVSATVSGIGHDYYCKLYSLGSERHVDNQSVTYRAEIWLDNWDGSNQVADLTLNSALDWQAYRLGFASCCFAAGDNLQGDSLTRLDCNQSKVAPTWLDGRISDFVFTVDYDSSNCPFGVDDVDIENFASIRIPDGTANYVSVPITDELHFDQKRHTIDFWVKFNTLPDPGDYVTLISAWDGSYSDGASGGEDRAWSLRLYNTGYWYRLEWWVNGRNCNPCTLGSETWIAGYTQHLAERTSWYDNNLLIFVDAQYFVAHKWYWLAFTTGKSNNRQGFNKYAFIVTGGRPGDEQGFSTNVYRIPKTDEIKIGEKFDGWISEVRISRGDDAKRFDASGYGGNRWEADDNEKRAGYITPPSKVYEKLYTFSVYVSDDNAFFGHYADVDTMFENSYSYYYPSSFYAQEYLSYFAVDLDRRRDLDIVRHYGADNLYNFAIDANVIFSNIDTAEPDIAFQTEYTGSTNDSFFGWGEEPIDTNKWEIIGLGNRANDYIRLNNGYLESWANSEITTAEFKTTYAIEGDFDVSVRWGRTARSPDTNGWYSIFGVYFSNGENGATYIKVQAEYDTSNPSPYYYMRVVISDDGSTTEASVPVSGLNDSGMRIVRKREHFYCYYYNGGWIELSEIAVADTISKDALYIKMGTTTMGGYPTVVNYYQDFAVNSADKLIMRSDVNDARWVAIEMLNGDGTDRFIEKLGIYPDITTSVDPSGDDYNCEWDNLGPSITAYDTENNLALGATVSGSSYKGEYTPDNTVNGIVDNEFSNVWATDSTSEQWLEVDLGEEKQIFRIKLYHGWSDDDSNTIIQDYRIETSTDNSTYTTQFTITGNSSFIRTHDLANSVTARYVRLYITGYIADWRYVRVGSSYEHFQGAVLREIEVYEYYGYSLVNSEDYPVIAIDLRDQFYVTGHSLIGIDAESTRFDWDNSDANFAYSDNIFNDPRKVVFKEFGNPPEYEQWVAIKRDTATYYNASPPVNVGLNDYGIDYLKHAVIKSDTKANPIDYDWWWQANLSTLSSDYDRPVQLCERSLKIEYPASAALDEVSFRGGTDFGVDSDMAYRDGVAFRLYIDDVDKLDTSEGYFYFGGMDGTNNPKPVEYRWYLSTFSGTSALQTGWNRPYFRFMTADEVVYTDASNPTDEIHPLMREYMTMDTVGLKFKGRGEALTMNMDGFLIQRNHFNDYSKFNPGLYLNNTDYLTCPLGEIDFTAGTIEFWLRPDYTFAGADAFNRFKNRSIFHFGNVVNDVFGMMITSYGVVIYFGNMIEDLSAFTVAGITASAIDNLFHIGVVFSSNGKHIGPDNSTIRLYINNLHMGTNYQTWDLNDNKSFKFTFGGKNPLGIIEHSSSLEMSSVDGVISNLRIYNYCKTDFLDSMENIPDSERVGNLTLPSKFIEISKDNVTFYKVGDGQLPLLFEKVPAGDVVPIYVRSIVPATLAGYESRTSEIVVSWDVGV